LGAPTYLRVASDDCNRRDDVDLIYGDDGTGRVEWEFIAEGEFFRIRNKYLVGNGCGLRSWLRSNTYCSDRDVIRDEWYPQSLWKIVPNEEYNGLYTMISWEKEPACKESAMSVLADGKKVDWWLDD